MTHSYVTWLIWGKRTAYPVSVFTHSYVTWHIHIWHDSCICDMAHAYETWLMHMGHDSCILNMTHSYDKIWLIHVWHDSYDEKERHVRHRSLWHDSCICDMTYSYRIWLIYMGYDSSMWDMTPRYKQTGRKPRCRSSHTRMRLIHTRRDSFTWDMTHSNGILFIHMTKQGSVSKIALHSFTCDVTQSCRTWLIHT